MVLWARPRLLPDAVAKRGSREGVLGTAVLLVRLLKAQCLLPCYPEVGNGRPGVKWKERDRRVVLKRTNRTRPKWDDEQSGGVCDRKQTGGHEQTKAAAGGRRTCILLPLASIAS